MTSGDPGEYGLEPYLPGRYEVETYQAEPVVDDLWSAPSSAVPAEEPRGGVLLGERLLFDARDGLPTGPELLPGPTETEPDPPGAPDTAPVPGVLVHVPRHSVRVRRRHTGTALLVAIVVLAGLGVAAQRLDPSRGSGAGTTGVLSTVGPSAAASSPATTPATDLPATVAGDVASGGPACPMQLSSAGLDCFYIG